MKTQYTMLLLELEQIDKHVQKTKKATSHDNIQKDSCHRPVHIGEHGDVNTNEGGAQAA